MSSEYPIFKYNNEIVVIKPGEQFSTSELKARINILNKINKNSDEYQDNQDKSTLKKLYDLSMRDDKNKILLFDKLKKDTELYRLKSFQRNKMQTTVNVIKDKEMNLENNLKNNHKVQLERAHKIIESSEDEKNEDNKSIFSYFNDYYSKISEQILYHVIFGFIIIILTLTLLYIYRIHSEEIHRFTALLFTAIINFNYYWYLIPLICVFLFIFLFLKYGKKIKIKKVIKKIMKKFKGKENSVINDDNNNYNEI